VLSVALFSCGDNIRPAEDCNLPGDEDENGMADCADPACATFTACQVFCGNGRLEASEACDDGNRVEGDGCDNNCTQTACGNGRLTMNEGCDDGNSVDGDGCDSNCTKTGCGNGKVTGTEVCDDGNATSGDGCDNNCTPTGCGNGVQTTGEACDDGNTVNGDGCDNNCTVTACGNGVVTGTEACDDGNTTNGDGCDNNCTVTACGNGVVTGTEVCDDGNATNGDGCDNNCTVTACGNGIPTTGEACDDGNTINGDGCDNNCTTTACGNGITTTGEECDDGNATSGDGCDVNCTTTRCGNGITTTGEECDDANTKNGDGCDINCTTSRCGNGAVAPGEDCDDGNLVNGDGCDVNCTTTRCGNGIVTAGEVCDDGNIVNGDGCDSNCTITSCGNGVVTAGEVCDDGNGINGDGCDVNCTLSACGNNVVAPGEQCDDGNIVDLDGCSAICRVEPTEIEPNEDGTPSTGGVGTNGNDFGSAFADANGAFTGSVVILAALNPVGDEDVFKLTNTSSVLQSVRLDTWDRSKGIGVPCATTFDLVLHVRNAAGASFGFNDNRNASDRCASVTFGLLPGQSVYAHVSENGDNATIAGYVLEASFRPAACGDGVISAGETCEDGNTTPGDGCDALCQIEPQAEVEPNGTTAQATANAVQITGDVTIRGSIGALADLDMYRVTVTTGTVVRFETFEQIATIPYECPVQTLDIRLRDSVGTLIVTDTAGHGVGACGELMFFLAPGTYFISVEERGNNATVPTYFLQVDYLTDRGAESEPPNSSGVNDSTATASTNLQTSNHAYVFGDHQLTGDADVYAITVPPLAAIHLETIEGNRAVETCEGLSVDTRITLFDSTATQVVDVDDLGRGFCTLVDGTGSVPLHAGLRNFTNAPQTYYIMVRESAFPINPADTQFVYRLTVDFR